MTTTLALLALAAPQTFEFKGGSIQALTSALHAQLGSSAVAEIFDDEQVIPAFKASTEGDELTKAISTKADYKLKRVGAVLVLFTGKVSPSLYCALGPKYPSLGQTKAPFGIDVKFIKSKLLPKRDCLWNADQGFSAETNSNHVLTLNSLLGYETLPKTWSCPWPYLNDPMAFSVSHLKLPELLRAVGKAVGSKVAVSAGMVAMRFDPAQYKQRYVAACEDPKVQQTTSGEYEKFYTARLHFHILAMQNLPDAFISKAFETKEYQHLEVGGNGPLDTACRDFTKDLFAVARQPTAGGVIPDPMVSGQLDNIDADRPVSFMFQAPAQMFLLMPLKPRGSLPLG